MLRDAGHGWRPLRFNKNMSHPDVNGYTISVCRFINGKQEFLSSVFIDAATIQPNIPEMAELAWKKAHERQQYLSPEQGAFFDKKLKGKSPEYRRAYIEANGFIDGHDIIQESN